MSQPRETAVEAYMDQVAAMIRDHGWAIQTVLATEGKLYGYAYTIGLVQRGATAELLIAGLPVAAAADALNQIAASMLNQVVAGSTILPPAEWRPRKAGPGSQDYVLKSKVFVPRVGGQLHVGVIRVFYGQDVPVAQFVWPDVEHRYPWDEGWDPELVQPVGNE